MIKDVFINTIESIGFSKNTTRSILNATLLLFISIAGNFLAETLGCKTQYYLENMIVKHILILFMIYFTINFTQGDEIVNPLENLKRAIIVWIIFHLFTHLDIIPTVLVLLMFGTLFFISNYTNYLESTGREKSKLYKQLLFSEQIIFICIITTIVVGFCYYYWEKKDEYGKRFNLVKFIFGVKKCKSLK